jgi:hypothetical protein
MTGLPTFETANVGVGILALHSLRIRTWFLRMDSSCILISSWCRSGIASGLLFFYIQGTLVGFRNRPKEVETKDVL